MLPPAKSLLWGGPEEEGGLSWPPLEQIGTAESINMLLRPTSWCRRMHHCMHLNTCPHATHIYVYSTMWMHVQTPACVSLQNCCFYSCASFQGAKGLRWERRNLLRNIKMVRSRQCLYESQVAWIWNFILQEKLRTDKKQGCHREYCHCRSRKPRPRIDGIISVESE